MKHRVTLYSLSGDAMIYNDFATVTEARQYAEWAKRTLPCSVRTERDACNDNLYAGRVENELGS